MILRHSSLPRSAIAVLTAIADSKRMGTVYRSGNGRLAFVYDPEWVEASGAFPLSLCMPLSAAVHGNGAIKTWLWGLMPDDPQVLDGWGKRFGVSTVDIVGLLSKVGEECAGAVQFVHPESAPRLLQQEPPTMEHLDAAVRWIDGAEVAGRLRELRTNASAGRRENDPGQFSLAGAQPKTALYESPDGRWGIPMGRWPTNRILKPPVLDIHELAWNEHLCLDLIRRLGWRAARSSVRAFTDERGTEQAIVVDRYDRIALGGVLTRVHQEDCCQALRVLPTRKYETQGGPTVEQVEALIRNESSASVDDRQRFLDAVALNWLIGGIDAHGKNFALLIAAEKQVRLAPLYDVISLLPYPELRSRDHTLAMSIGGERRIAEIGRAHWEKLGGATWVGRREIVERVAHIADQTIDVARALQDERAGTPFVDVLMPAIAAHARACRERLAT